MSVSFSWWLKWKICKDKNLYSYWKIFVFQIVQPTDAGPCFPGHLDSKQFAEVSMELSSLERAPTLILTCSRLTHAVWKEMRTWCFLKRQLTTFVVKLSSGKLELSEKIVGFLGHFACYIHPAAWLCRWHDLCLPCFACYTLDGLDLGIFGAPQYFCLLSTL